MIIAVVAVVALGAAYFLYVREQSAYYSGRKKTHSDKNVVVVEAGSERVGFLSRTYAG